MKLRYLDEDNTVMHEVWNIQQVPRVGDMVFMEEIFFVKDVVWYPKDDMVHIYVVDRLITKPKVVESKAKVVNLQLVGKAQKTADEALKEATELKRQVFSIRQYLKNQPKAPTKNDT